MIFPIRFNEKNRRKLIFQQSSKKSINKFLKLLVQCYSREFVEKILVNKKLNTTFDELHIIITFALIISISRYSNITFKKFHKDSVIYSTWVRCNEFIFLIKVGI
ncbi:hypothetical protein GS518_18435 [Leptospira interrogans]|uniref:Transposase n=3 Tax=Leptospira interrogans TaxID=173 RepID=A0AAW4JXS4_LEPIR|nr:hypothetical protein [Leptospira interrogans]OOB97312.1 hypothetical protein B0192_17460 [Leptospira interrogans serovar Australis]ARB94327.1 hypothetical protein A6J42_01025 [Leptospira interrogans serovar Copenhageni]ASP43247.1 hypothetical protein AMR47_21225 [Leptospira interrogans]KAA5552622.1 hypothetical protein F3G11_01650 [Leptospira interrogans serovar Copenhageni]MBO7985232.1 hypothetical protein [Leptospira interrogans serovar Copenhageni]